MESVKSARARLRRYPALIGACSPQAATYAKCVTARMGEVQKGQCQPEFDAFKACLRQASQKLKSKL